MATVTVNLTDIAETVLSTDLDENLISFYPNPATAHITINNGLLVRQINIWDLRGKLVERFEASSTNQYPIDKLRTGIYTITIESSDQILHSKLIVK